VGRKSKLNLSIDSSLVRRAKRYAAMRNASLSSLIEGFLRALTTKVRVADLPPITRRASGICHLPERPLRQLMEDALEQKYRLRG
jgi:hypothetical protein